MKTIFVSSTFRDMHQERDIIHELVMPEINEFALKYGENISFCDLRWGVNTENLDSEEESRKVLSVCFDEIDRCRPYMLVLLGERYGWLPDSGLVQEVAGGRKGLELDDMEKSVTALEIEYGALSDPEKKDHTLFYFREFVGEVPEDFGIEDDFHARKMQELKARIYKIAGDRVRTYSVGWDKDKKRLTDMNGFSEQLVHDLKDMMRTELESGEPLTAFERDQRLQWEMARQKAEQFRGRYTLLERLKEQLRNRQGELGNLIGLTGTVGSGKTCLLSRLAVDLEYEGFKVLPVFCGSTALTNSAQDILEYIVWYFEVCLGEKNYEEASDHIFGQNGTKINNLDMWTAKLHTLVKKYEESEESDLLIFIDGADQLFPDSARESTCFIPDNSRSKKIRMIVSYLDTLYGTSMLIGRKPVEIGILDQDEKEEVIKSMLHSQGKELNEKVIRKITGKSGADNPLYLDLIVQRLSMMNKDDFDKIAAKGDGIEAITDYQLELVAAMPEEVTELCNDIIMTAIERIGGCTAEEALRYIAASRYGLRETDLSTIFAMQGFNWIYGSDGKWEAQRNGVEWNGLKFALFLKYMKNFFIIRADGRLDFSHKAVREGIQKKNKNQKKYHRQIINGLEKLDDRDSVKMTEYLYHCFKADAGEEAVRYIGSKEQMSTSRLNAAGTQIRDIALEDQGKWLECVIKSIPANEEAEEFSRRLEIILEDTLRRTREEFEINIHILEALAELDSRLCKELKGRYRKQYITYIWTRTYIKLANAYHLMEDEQLYDRACTLLKKILKEWENPLRRNWDRRYGVCQECRTELAEILMEKGGRADLIVAGNCYKKLMRLQQVKLKKTEKKEAIIEDMQKTCIGAGEICRRLYELTAKKHFQKSHDEWFKYGIKISLELNATLSDRGDLRKRLCNWRKLALFYSEFDDESNLREAEKYQSFCLKYNTNPQTENELYSKGADYYNMGLIYSKLEGEEEKARVMYSRSVEVLLRIRDQDKDIINMNLLFDAVGELIPYLTEKEKETMNWYYWWQGYNLYMLTKNEKYMESAKLYEKYMENETD